MLIREVVEEAVTVRCEISPAAELDFVVLRYGRKLSRRPLLLIGYEICYRNDLIHSITYGRKRLVVDNRT